MNISAEFFDIKETLKTLKEQGYYDVAHQLLDEYETRSDDEQIELYRERVFLYRYQDDFKNAISYSEKIIKLTPNDIKVLFVYALSLVNVKNFKQAIMALSRIIELKDEKYGWCFSDASYGLRAFCYIELCDYKKAYYDIEKLPDDFLFDISFDHQITKKSFINFLKDKVV